MPNYVSKIKPDGMGGTEYNIKDAELREVVQNMQREVAGTQTATGNPITLTDCAPINAESLVVELEPKQDLHGYDFPWVGSAGKNKLPLDLATIKSLNTSGVWSGNSYTYNNVTFTVLTDNDGNVTGIDVDTNGGTASANTILTVTNKNNHNFLTETSYILNGCPVNAGGNLRLIISDDLTASYMDDGGGIQQFTPSSQFINNNYKCRIQVTSGVSASHAVFYPMLRLATETDPTFAPWENKCPISGYEGVEVETADSATDPTQSRTASVTFGQTVYGGRSDFTEGGTDDELEIVDLGDLTWTFGSTANYQFTSSVLADAVNTTDFTTDGVYCEGYEVNNQAYSQYAKAHCRGIRNKTIVIVNDAYTDATTFKNAMAGIKLTYPKATPTTIATPKTDFKLLQDTNNITTNGTTITLDYIPNNSIGDAVKASEEYTDRAVEAVEKLMPQKTVISNRTVHDGDTFSLTLPSSFNYIVFEVEFATDSSFGSAMYSSFEDGNEAHLMAYGHDSSRRFELVLANGTATVSGDFGNSGATLMISAF